jgi:hypothetical protein
MIKFWVVVYFLVAWAWFIFSITQDWGLYTLTLNIFSVTIGTISLYLTFVED